MSQSDSSYRLATTFPAILHPAMVLVLPILFECPLHARHGRGPHHGRGPYLLRRTAAVAIARNSSAALRYPAVTVSQLSGTGE